MRIIYIFLLTLIVITTISIFIVFGSMVLYAKNSYIKCETRSYVARNIKIAGSGINIMLATWEKHFTSYIERDGCDRCSVDEIPIENMRYEEEVCKLILKES